MVRRQGEDSSSDITTGLQQLAGMALSPLDLLPHEDLHEKLVELVLSGVPESLPMAAALALQQVKEALEREPVEDLNVVVFGGGTGLSTIIGGDSRAASWSDDPFSGLKSLFPKTRSIVCITDDGGSTGELLKDLPLIALGDIRHVLISSLQLAKLQELYGLTEPDAVRCAKVIAGVFNYRFTTAPKNSRELNRDCGLSDQQVLPLLIREGLERLIENLFEDLRLKLTFERPNCLGNLIVVSAVYEQISGRFSNEELVEEPDLLRQNIHRGIAALCVTLGADEQAVMPCTCTPAELCFRYTNGVQVTGEDKSGHAQRGYPVDRVYVSFSKEPQISEEVLNSIRNADIMLMAPGSLYSSLIPIFQVPRIADAVKNNTGALKILVSNIWVQAGETDLSLSEPDRKFHLSDLLKAYQRNIPGGTGGLFDKVLCLSFKDVPASVIQNYAVEGKIPIYLDREEVRFQGVDPLECGIYSTSALRELKIIRHDPSQFARVVRTLWAGFRNVPVEEKRDSSKGKSRQTVVRYLLSSQIPCQRFQQIREALSHVHIELQQHASRGVDTIRSILLNLLWEHKDIPISHLQYVRGVQCIETKQWKRNQQWDRIYSFFDPADGFVKIRQDQFDNKAYLKVAFLVALGQSLLGNYVHHKRVRPVIEQDTPLGKVYHLHLRDAAARNCYFSEQHLAEYLRLGRMVQDPDDPLHFTRLINETEGFTPPGLLMGLTYAWYLDNRFATHIEYKMGVIKVDQSNLIPEQVRMRGRRKKMVEFFRSVVFCLAKQAEFSC